MAEVAWQDGCHLGLTRDYSHISVFEHPSDTEIRGPRGVVQKMKLWTKSQ